MRIRYGETDKALGIVTETWYTLGKCWLLLLLLLMLHLSYILKISFSSDI